METKVKWLIIAALIFGAVLLVSAVHVQGLMGVAVPMWDRATMVTQDNPKPDPTQQRMNERMYVCLPMTDRKYMMGMHQGTMNGMSGPNNMGNNCGTMQPMMGSMMMQHHRYGSMDRR